MEAIQIQTPPRDDEIATLDTSTPLDAIEVEDAPEELDAEAEAFVDAEIVVETNNNEADKQNGNDDDVSSLSSAPVYGSDQETSKPGRPLRGQLTRYHQELKTHATSGSKRNKTGPCRRD